MYTEAAGTSGGAAGQELTTIAATQSTSSSRSVGCRVVTRSPGSPTGWATSPSPHVA